MPRWLLILVTLTLYAAAMAAFWWVLKLTVPGVLDFTRARIGHVGIWAAFLVLGALCAYVAYWPREPDGTFRRLSRRR